MVFKWAAQVLQGWSAKAVLQRLDKRKLQHELDTHRLFLLTSYHRRQQLGGAVEGAEELVEQLAQQAEELKFEGMKAAVASNLQSQALALSTALHAILQRQGDPAPAAAALAAGAAAQRARAAAEAARLQPTGQGATARPARGRGLEFALGSAAAAAMQDAAAREGAVGASSGNGGGGGSSSSSSRAATAPAASEAAPAASSQAAAAAAGAPATQGHRQERAQQGQQGRSLSAAQLAAAFRQQAGFALRVGPSSIEHSEAGDGLWVEGSVGIGQVVALYPGVAYSPLQYRQIPGYPKIDRNNPYFIGRFDGVVLDAKPWGRGLPELVPTHKGGEGEAQAWPAQPQNEAEAALALVEGRHPLALAHFANHPPAGVAPNVMVAAFDFRAPEDAPQLRAYLPYVLYRDPAQQARQGAVAPGETVTGLALVATRDLEGEEVFLNYRLSPHVARPGWYTPVDAEEEQRRWA